MKKTLSISNIVSFFLTIFIVMALFLSHSKINEIYVLTSKDSNDFLQNNVQRNITNDWVISDLQLKEMSKRLNGVLRFRVLPTVSFNIQLLNYEKNDVKYTYFNAFCNLLDDEADSLWKKELYIVNDGGECFFHGVYNLDEQKILFLFFNSQAV